MEENFFGDFLIAIQNRLNEMVPELKYINIDLGQLELENPPVSWPCYLVDFGDTNYNDLHNNEQEGETMISGRLGFNPFSQTSSLQPESVRKLGLAYFALENKINKALHGWQPLKEDGEPLCQPLSRRRAVTERREEDTLRIRPMYYTTGFHDDGAAPNRNTLRPDIIIETEFLQEEN